MQTNHAWRKPSGAVRALGLMTCAALLAAAAHAGSVSHTYDALGRVATVVYNNGTTTTTIKYSYDAAGNRTSVVTTSP
jgi:YD repeat-containing protein